MGKQFIKKYAKTYDSKGNVLPKEQWQLVGDHLLNVATLAKSFAEPFGLGEEAFVAGLTHDMGKYLTPFQDKINGVNNGFKDHCSAGASYLYSNGYEMASLAVSAHHTSLNNNKWAAAIRSKQSFKEATDDFEQDFKALVKKERPKQSTDSAHQLRYVFSCLIDADWTDSEVFSDSAKANQRKVYSGTIQSQLDNAINKLDDLVGKISHISDLNTLRNKFYKNCVEVGKHSTQTMFSLTGVTGIGKTYASLGFALHHAKKFNKNRIFIVLPYMTITEQTAKEMSKIFGAENILEHHTNFNSDGSASSSSTLKYKFLSENWDCQVIVTTTAQFFDSLYSNDPRTVRKIHNIANSVVILDESQTFPLELLDPTLDVIEYYNRNFKTSFVFSTATPPDFKQVHPKLVPVEIINDPEEYRLKLKRCDIVFEKNPMNFDDVVSELISHDSAFCIVNTKKDVKSIYNRLKSKNIEHKIVYLTTGLCSQHRSKVISEIRMALKSNEKIILVCTQLIEAGVDFDFLFGMRMVAPLPSIIQAAGRVNREGLRTAGKLLVFQLNDQFLEFSGHPMHFPDSMYMHNAQQSVRIMNKHTDLTSPTVLSEYYRSIYGVLNTDQKKCIKSLQQWDFENVRYNYINSPTKTVIVPYGKEGESMLKEILRKDTIDKSDLNNTRGIVVNMFPNTIDRFEKNDMVQEIDGSGIYCWLGSYDPETGID